MAEIALPWVRLLVSRIVVGRRQLGRLDIVVEWTAGGVPTRKTLWLAEGVREQIRARLAAGETLDQILRASEAHRCSYREGQ